MIMTKVTGYFTDYITDYNKKSGTEKSQTSSEKQTLKKEEEE